MNKEFLPFAQPDIDDKDINSIINALRSNWLSRGPKVTEFENKLKSYLENDDLNVVACNSGTAALHLGLLSLNIGPGDEVLVPSLTFAASVNVIIHVGATPVFVDVNEETLNIDITDLKNKITNRSKAIIGVHFAGRSIDLISVRSICQEYNLFLIEDAAHAFGTVYESKKIGYSGDIVCFSFYATKNITTGEGGALITLNTTLAERARLYAWHGINNNAWNRYSKEGSWRYDIQLPGYKYNMTDIQASLGISQLAKLEIIKSRRVEIAQKYNEELSELKDFLILPEQLEGHSWHLYVVRVIQNKSFERDYLASELKSRGIGTSVHYYPVHLHSYYTNNYPTTLKKTEELSKQILSLPIYSRMTDYDVERVVRNIKDIIEEL